MPDVACLARTYFRFFVVITFFIPFVLACNVIICASLPVVLEVVVFLKITACLTQRYVEDGREMYDIPDADNFLCPKGFVLNM